MEASTQPLRCPKCQALVVDRRSPTCTTCRAELPAEWIMTKDQAAKMMKLDAQARATHRREMQELDPRLNPNIPAAIKFIDMSSRI